MTKLKRIAVAVLALLSCACVQRRATVAATIVLVEDGRDGWRAACGGDVRTVAADARGARYAFCGRWGEVGDDLLLDLHVYRNGDVVATPQAQP